MQRRFSIQKNITMMITNTGLRNVNPTSICLLHKVLLTIPPRHVQLPKELYKMVPKKRLMSETEWRGIGVQQSQGWIHYMIHNPEPHILLFRRPKPRQ